MPSVIGRFVSFFSKFSDDIISDNTTLSLLGFGISIPTVLFPGIAETRADTELVFLAISSDKLTIFDTFTPGAGSNSYKETTGPLLTFLIFPSIPKSKRIFSIKSALGSFVLLLLIVVVFFERRFKEGKAYFLEFFSIIF